MSFISMLDGTIASATETTSADLSAAESQSGQGSGSFLSKVNGTIKTATTNVAESFPPEQTAAQVLATGADVLAWKGVTFGGAIPTVKATISATTPGALVNTGTLPVSTSSSAAGGIGFGTIAGLVLVAGAAWALFIRKGAPYRVAL